MRWQVYGSTGHVESARLAARRRRGVERGLAAERWCADQALEEITVTGATRH